MIVPSHSIGISPNTTRHPLTLQIIFHISASSVYLYCYIIYIDFVKSYLFLYASNYIFHIHTCHIIIERACSRLIKIKKDFSVFYFYKKNLIKILNHTFVLSRFISSEFH